MDSLQNSDPQISSNKETEDGTQMKRFKQEENSLNPLVIPHVLEKIFSFLDSESIKQARQVNKLWDIEGAKMLFTKCYILISSDMRGEKDPVKKNEKMEEFKAFLSKKSNQAVIVPNVAVNDANDVELLKSFGVLGKQVTSLKVHLRKDKNGWVTTLLNLLPNLKHFDLVDYEFYDEEDDNLLYNKERIIFIKALTSTMSKANKDQDPLTIPNIILSAEKKVDLEALEKFSDCSNIKIEQLRIVVSPSVLKNAPENETRVLNVVGKLLSTNQNSLTSFTLPCCEAYLNILDFPPMAQLTDLKLNFFSKTSGPFRRCEFPSSFRFSEKFPKLEDVTLEFKAIDLLASDDFFKNLFENTGKALAVKKLKLSTLYLDDTIAPIFQAFPNVEELEVIGSRCCKKMLYSIWDHGQNLKKLKITFQLSLVGNLADLDCILTGLSPKVVDWIKKTPKGLAYRFKNLEQSRVNSSILKLKGLEHLTISFMGGGGTATDFLPKRMLAVAGEHAFSLMPKNVKIEIYVRDCYSGIRHARKALREFAKLPNVKIGR